MNLKLMVMVWLRFERRCPIVIRERSPRVVVCGRPDVLGVTKNRYLIEVEIKRSMSDFRNDQQKSSRRTRDLYLTRAPRQFYYMAEPSLAEKIKPELPPWSGLITTKFQTVVVIVPAPVNRDSVKLTIRECIALAHLMANHIIAVEEKIESILYQYRAGWSPCWGINYEI